MRVTRVRFTVRRMMLAIAGATFPCGGVVCGVRALENCLVVENESGQPIAWLKIRMANAGRIAAFKEIPDRGVETSSFTIRGDDSFVVDGILADGTKLGGSFGYVTNGEYSVHPRLQVRRGGKIDFTQ